MTWYGPAASGMTTGGGQVWATEQLPAGFAPDDLQCGRMARPTSYSGQRRQNGAAPDAVSGGVPVLCELGQTPHVPSRSLRARVCAGLLLSYDD